VNLCGTSRKDTAGLFRLSSSTKIPPAALVQMPFLRRQYTMHQVFPFPSEGSTAAQKEFQSNVLQNVSELGSYALRVKCSATSNKGALNC
jgi:hypothetical protein